MSFLAENIVIFWLLPVLAQIVLPLFMLIGWMVGITIGLGPSRQREVEQSESHLPERTAKKNA
jgi:hypothetical protein